MTIEQGENGTLVCRQCGQIWLADDALVILLEQLVNHSKTHLDPEEADTAKPRIWLR